MAKMQVFTYENLEVYDELLKGHISSEDAKALKTVAVEEGVDSYKIKFYKVEEPVGSTAAAYEVSIPKTDLSGLIPKITGATEGNVVTAKSDGTVADSGVKVADLATKAEVGAVEDKADANTQAINAINDETTGILKTAKDYSDSKDTEIKNTIGAVTEGKTVVEMIEDAKTAATYDDTEVRGLISANASAIEAHKTAVDAKVTTLVGEDADKSVRTIASEETAKIVASAPEDFDTLKEIADWIEADKTRAAELTTKVSNNEKAIADEVTRATGVESGLDTRLSAVETLVGEGGSVDEKIAAAKSEAISTAATDATSKANTAETNAKGYADGLNTAMDTRVASLETKVGEGFEAIPEASIRALFA